MLGYVEEQRELQSEHTHTRALLVLSLLELQISPRWDK